MFQKKINWLKQETNVSEPQKKNPWLGLATYNTDDADRFRGRDKATQDVFSLIDNNLVVTLYGKSGIGKSSLVNAGIIPMLSSVGYKVISVNIREMKASCSNGEGVYNRTIAYLKTLLHIELETLDVTSLWKILHNKECFEEISEFPVVIFDQFEEVFLNTAPEDSDLFIKAISKLTDTGFSINDDSFIPNNRFRILLSLREDDLFRLEDSIDRNGFSRMKYNRYRLHSFTVSDAESIIALGKDYFENYGSGKQKITEMSSLPEGGVDAATLSLLCYRLFEKSRNNEDNIIKQELVSKENDPLFNQYMDEISFLTRKEQMFIENNLITSSGRRDIVKIDMFKANIKNADKLLENSETHFSLFRVIDREDNVELIHDSLARAINKHREQRAYRTENLLYNIKNNLSRLCLLLCITQFFIILPFYFFVIHNANSTENHFFQTGAWSWVIFLVPILNLVFVTHEKNLRNILILAVPCGLMSINCAFPNLSLKYSVIIQILLCLTYIISTLILIKKETRTLKILNVLYLNIVTIACVCVGFGYNILSLRNVVKMNSFSSRPWSYVAYENDNKYGYSDWSGSQVLPCVFDTIVVDSANVIYLSKRVRALDLKNEGLRYFFDSKNTAFPCYYKNGVLSFYILPNIENQIRKLSNGTEESRLKASIIRQSRERVIKSFANRKSMYDTELAKDIGRLYNIQLDSAYHLLKSLNDYNSIITDETVNNIRINLSQCICMLHMLESFGKQKAINDDDIAHSILALQYFTLFEVMDTGVKGYNADNKINFNLDLISNGKTYHSYEYESYNLKGYLEKNKRDVYSAFNSLIIFDIAIHKADLTEFLNRSVMNAESIYSELLDILDQAKKSSADIDKINAMVLQNAISILLDNSFVSSKQRKISQLQDDVSNKYSQVLNIVKKTESLLDKPLYMHNTDVFNYSKVISPLIKCIAENDLPDQSTALTDIACRLIVMGMFRGLEMHDCIVELQNAYKRSTERTIKKTFETVLTIDSMEVEYRQATNEFKKQLKDIKIKK